MNFLRTLGWILLTVVVVVFSLHNWVPVTINLFAGLQADVKLPVLLLIAFLLGFVPLYLYYRTVRWRLRKRLAAAERTAPLAAAVPRPELEPAIFGPTSGPL